MATIILKMAGSALCTVAVNLISSGTPEGTAWGSALLASGLFLLHIDLKEGVE